MSKVSLQSTARKARKFAIEKLKKRQLQGEAVGRAQNLPNLAVNDVEALFAATFVGYFAGYNEGPKAA